MILFLDTEFTDLGLDPKLISIGLVAEDGVREFYAELNISAPEGEYSYFVREAVLPHLAGGVARMEWHELSLRLGNWIESLDGSVQIATDSPSWDWPWIQELFMEPGTWPENLGAKPIVLDFAGRRAFNEAVETAFAGGLRRHHALDDAKANRLGWLAENPPLAAKPGF